MKNLIAISISAKTPYLVKLWVKIQDSNCRILSSVISCLVSRPIKLHDSLKGNISRRKPGMELMFCMQININVFYELAQSFVVGLVRHAQST